MFLNRESLDQVSNSKAPFVFVLDSLMAEQQPENKSTLEETKVPPANEADEEALPKAGSPVPPNEKATTPELTESPEMVAAMPVELTTARTETEALMEAIKEVPSSVENEEGQEGTSKLIKVMLLGLKAQRSISQGGCIEMKQIAVKQLDLLRHVASGFADQTDLLQQVSDDIGANLNALAQSFVKLSDVIKDGHTQSKDGGTDIENRHRQLLEKLDSQNVYFLHIRNGVNKMLKELQNLQWTAEELRTGGKEGKSGTVNAKAVSLLATLNRNLAEILERYPVDLASMTDEITKSLKGLEGIMKEGLEKKRPAEGPPPVEPKRVKFQHPGTKEEHGGTEMERDQKMAQWWAEIAAASARSGSVTGNPGQPMPPPGMAPPSATPMTPVSGDGGMPIPSYGFPLPLIPGYYYGPPPPVGTTPNPNLPAPTGMTAPTMTAATGQSM